MKYCIFILSYLYFVGLLYLSKMFWILNNVTWFSLINVLFVVSYVLLVLRSNYNIRNLTIHFLAVIAIYFTVYKPFLSKLFNEEAYIYSIQIIILLLISLITPIIKIKSNAPRL